MRLLFALTLFLFTYSENLAGTVGFTVQFEDVIQGTGMGFDDPQLGASRRALVEAVVAQVAGDLDEKGNVEVMVRASLNDANQAPVQGEPYFNDTAGFQGGHAFDHIINLVDPCRLDNCGEDVADMWMQFNFAYDFYVGADTVGAQQYDMHTLVLGMMLKGLGLISLSDDDGSSREGDGIFSRYDALLRDAAGQPLWAANGSFQADPAILTADADAVFFGGQRTALAYDGSLAVTNPGDFDENTSLQGWRVQEGGARIAPTLGYQQRTPGLFERTALMDLGYKLKQATTLVFPWVSNSDDFASNLIINNPSDTPAEVAVTAQRADGSKETLFQEVPARGFFQQTAEALFPNLGRGSGVCVVVTSDQPGIKGRWVTNDRPQLVPSQGIAVTVPAEGGNDRLAESVLLGFQPGGENFISAAVLVHVGSEPTTITLQAFAADGSPQAPLVFENVNPFQPLVAAVTSAEDGDLHMVAEANGTLLTGVSFVFNNLGQTAIGNAEAVSDGSNEE